MLHVLFSIWPGGDKSRARVVGEAEIANVGGNNEVGDYAVRLFQWGAKRKLWKKGDVLNFPRQTRGPWDLLFRGVANIVARRNTVVQFPRDWVLEEQAMSEVELAVVALNEAADNDKLREAVANFLRLTGEVAPWGRLTTVEGTCEQNAPIETAWARLLDVAREAGIVQPPSAQLSLPMK